MSPPPVSGGPEVRQQLAEALDEHFTRHFTPSNGRIAIRCGCGWKGADWVHVDDAAREHREHIADALMAHVDRITTERAAEALRDLGKLLGYVPLSEREQLRKGERMQVSERTAAMHDAANLAFARAEAMVTGRQEGPWAG